MTTWEYFTAYIDREQEVEVRDPETLQEWLNSVGHEGWELVQGPAYNVDGGAHRVNGMYVFKRPKP